MSHIDVHDVRAIARARLARTAQVDALEPHGPTTPQARDWGGDRRRLLLGRYRQQLRPGDIALGDDLAPAPSGGGGGGGLALPRWQIDYAQQRTYSLDFAHAGVVEFAAASTPPIPFAFIITSLTVWAAPADGAIENNTRWNLYITDGDVTGSLSQLPTGRQLISQNNFGFAADNENFGPRLQPHSGVRGLATGPIGDAVLETGKRVTAVVWRLAGAGTIANSNFLFTVAPIMLAGGGGGGVSAPRPPSAGGEPPPPPTGTEWEEIF